MSDTATPGRLLKLQDVVRETSLSRPTIYRAMSAGTFPRPLQIGRRRVAWPEAAIETWKAQLPATGKPA